MPQDENWWDKITNMANKAGRLKARRMYLKDVKEHLPEKNYQEELAKFKKDFPGVSPEIEHA